MKSIYEYGERKEQKGIEKGMQKGMHRILVKLYESGMSIKEIAEKTELDTKQVEEILS